MEIHQPINRREEKPLYLSVRSESMHRTVHRCRTVCISVFITVKEARIRALSRGGPPTHPSVRFERWSTRVCWQDTLFIVASFWFFFLLSFLFFFLWLRTQIQRNIRGFTRNFKDRSKRRFEGIFIGGDDRSGLGAIFLQGVILLSR